MSGIRRVLGCGLLVLLPVVASAASKDARGITVEPVSATAPSGNAGLFVGVNQFSKDPSLRPLNFAVNDAIAQAHLFVIELKLLLPANTCLALSGTPSSDTAKTQLKILTEAGVRRTDGTKTDILSSLLSIRNAAQGSSDLLVFSISSHGFEERGMAYALPSDGLRGALEDTALNLASVEQKLAQSKAGKRLLLIDACREQPTTDSKSIGDTMSVAFRSALAAAEGQATLASCDAGQLSIEKPELGHGVFTYFLLKALHGEASADARGFITLGAVSDYVADFVHKWVRRNKPAADQRLAQQPWFKGPVDAKQIPLAVDPRVHAGNVTFKQDVMTTLSALRAKVSDKGKFNFAMYQRLADALDKVQGDEVGRKLLEHSRDFLNGKISEAFFVGFLERELAELKTWERNRKIAELLATAKANDNKENGKTALAALDELLKLDPTHREALALRAKIAAYYVETKLLDLGRGVKMELVRIPPGEFMMGDKFYKPVHRVRLTKGFWMGKYEVTQEQYEAVMDNNPSAFKGTNNPVENVSWDDAVAFCKKVGGRLPTEAEWEYACRAGTTTKYHSGDVESDLARVGWYDGNRGKTSHPVGGKEANAWGLYDMHGNVWEWCADWHGDYPNREITDPTGSANGSFRVLRGGSWMHDAAHCLSATRNGVTPSCRLNLYGFRVCVDSP